MPSRHIWPLYALLLSALAWVFFADVLTLGLDTHDVETFRDHERISEDFAYFFSPDKEQASGRPVAEIVKFLYFMVLGNTAAAFHLLSLALHVLCSFLLARVALQCGAALELSLLGGLLFLCNIAHFQVVHYISALDYALALALGFGALLAYRRYLITANLAHLGAYYILLLTAVFAHLSMVIILPFSLYLSRKNAERTTTALRRLAPLAVLLGLAFLAQLALASRETSTWNALEHYPDTDPFALIISWLRVFLWLLSRLLTTAHWLPLPVYTMQTWELYLGGFALIGLAFCVYRSNLWAVWTLLALAPFVFLTEATLLDMPAGPSRYLYPASAGASLLLAQILYRIRQRPLRFGLVLVLLLSSYFTLDKSEALSRYTSGRSYIANRQIPKGIDQLRRAIDTGGEAIDRKDAHTRLLTVALDSTAIAASILQKARGDFPEDIWFALAEQVFHSVGSDSIRQRQAQLSLESNRGQNEGNDRWIAHLYANMGDGYFARRDWTRAIRAHENALRFDAKRKETRLLLGWTYFMTNRFTEAIATYRAVLTQSPDSEAHFSIGLAHIALGDTATATKIYADGIAQYGREQAETAKARDNLERLISLGTQPETARNLILRHFPD